MLHLYTPTDIKIEPMHTSKKGIPSSFAPVNHPTEATTSLFRTSSSFHPIPFLNISATVGTKLGCANMILARLSVH